MIDPDELRDASETVADGVTALVGVTDEGLKGASAGLNRIADGMAAFRELAPLIAAAAAASTTPLVERLEGFRGADGADGKDGVDGASGPRGSVGPQGNAGRDGIDGADGLLGRPGKAGLKGDPGPRGFDGAPGPGPVRVVVERENQLIAFAQVYLDDGSTRRMAVRRDANRRFTELVRVSA